MKRYICILTIVSLLLIILASCDLPIDIVQKTPDEADLQAIEITLAPTPRPTPYCPGASSFGKFWEHYPQNFNLLPANSEFLWFYNFQGVQVGSVEAWANFCVPSSFTLVFSTGPEFDDEIYVPVTNPSLVFTAGSLEVRWALTTPLEPMKIYRWVAVGDYNDIQIKYNKISTLHDDTKWPPRSTLFNMGTFLTGPLCALGAIETPVLGFPANGEVISSLRPKLTWNFTNCTPKEYKIQLSKNADLENLANNFWSFSTLDYTVQPVLKYPWLDVSGFNSWQPLPDCTRFYWRVIGTSYNDEAWIREWGEWSEVRSFYVNSGSCPTPTPTLTPNRNADAESSNR
ncbi:MAG: hypothetical protein FD147_2332 [Chloroflexi bacterium]|nr:MAG: hypothetical protein FD147_2332 [Chloroflexota bacterium]